jgi:glycosyltransferase involved in cell wall biosynthesis
VGPRKRVDPMHITLITGELGFRTSGQSRFAVNLAAGLRRAGHAVTICGSATVPETVEQLRSGGIEVLALREGFEGEARRARLLTPFSNLGRSLAELALRKTDADWYVVVADGAVGAGKYLQGKRRAYICNGDLSVMFLSSGFYRTHRTSKELLALGMARFVRRNAENARHYEALLANSEFTRQFMSYLYALPFHGIVYPPVDTARFSPPASAPPEPSYVLALARNSNEQGLDLLARLAQISPMRVVGGARVPGAQSAGEVPEDQLIALYGNAKFLAFPVVPEFFGYAIAEAHACGTPVLAFDTCGASEQIQSGKNGWLVRTEAEFESEYRRVSSEDVLTEMRTRCRSDARSRSIEASTQQLLTALESPGGSRPFP